MNRLEIFCLVILAFVVIVLTIRSRWFDRILDYAFRTSKKDNEKPDTATEKSDTPSDSSTSN